MNGDSGRYTQELHCLNEGPSPDEQPPGMVVEFIVQCDGDVQNVLDRSISVLGIVVRAGLEHWPTDNQWRAMLPDWFVEKCASEQSLEEAEAWLKMWRNLGREEQIQVERNMRWPLENWLYWLQPDHRHWFWWNATILNDNMASVSIVVEGWPFPWGSLSWLLRASGAKEVSPLGG